MKKQQKKKKKLVVEDFRSLTSTFQCEGVITECQIKDDKKKTVFRVTAKVLPEDTDVDDWDEADYYQDTFEVELEKKYSSEEEKMLQKYLIDMPCEFWPNYCDEDGEELCTSITPQNSPACIVDMLLPAGKLMGYEIPHKK